jgi:hypothetical protein
VENFIILLAMVRFYYINIDPKESVNYKLDLDGVRWMEITAILPDQWEKHAGRIGLL